jgi:hypothetical protein
MARSRSHHKRHHHRDPEQAVKLNGEGVLRSIIEGARHEHGFSLGDLTVLSIQVDPYRIDTASGHRDGAWVAQQLKRLVKGGKKIHWRGLHYVIVSKGSIRKPNGEVFRNDDDDWTWLSSVAGKAARWLGYVPFEQIVDNRNAEPVIFRKAKGCTQGPHLDWSRR